MCRSPVAGQLISAGALLMCLGAPLFAAIVAGWDRRRLLALSMLWFGALHLACTLMPTFATLLPMRVLAVISPAIFTPQAAACVGLLVACPSNAGAPSHLCSWAGQWHPCWACRWAR
jgi:predicted MFS family arabinose efflux permease